MNHFLSRIGRTPVGRHFMPTLSCVTVCGYLGLHTLSHGLIRKFFVAQGPDGEPIQISDYLRDMITDVFAEVDKSGFHVDVFKLKDWSFPVPTIRWFASYTLDPIVYGMTDFATGVSIGVPNSYNYREPADLPDSVFEVKKLSIIRSPQGRELEEKKTEDKSSLVKTDKEPVVLVRRIDKNSQEGAITTSRAYVDVFKLKDRHITHRMPGYVLAGILYIGLYMFVGGAADEYVDKKATEKAKNLGENYVAGAEEYFRKQEVRNGILGVRPSKYF